MRGTPSWPDMKTKSDQIETDEPTLRMICVAPR